VETELVGSVLDPVPPPSLAIYKEHKHSTRRIDLAVCAIMAHSVAATVDPGLLPYWFTRSAATSPRTARHPVKMSACNASDAASR
jgi:hypothetical protein